MPGDPGGILPNPFRLTSGIATHVQGVPDQDFRNAALFGDLGDGGQIAAFVLAFESGQTLGRQSEVITDGQTYATPAQIERENFQISLYVWVMIDSSRRHAVALVSRPVNVESNVQQLNHFAAPVIAFGVIIAILYWARAFFITSAIAVVLAFILQPFVALLVKAKFPRSVASFFVLSVAALALYLTGLGAYSQISSLLTDLPEFSQRVAEIVDSVRAKVEHVQQVTYELVIPARQRRLQQASAAPAPRRRKADPAAPAAIQEVRIHDDRNPVLDYVGAHLEKVYRLVLMASFVPFLVYFILSWGEHIRRNFLQCFQPEDRVAAARSVQGIAMIARGFVVGNFMLGLILALVSSASFWLMNLPYALLAGPLSGFLSLVPYVGLPLAMVPPLFIALAGPNNISSYFLIVAVVAGLHVFAMNVLYPKVVGSRVHLNPLVVTFALMLWGFLWDAWGLVLAIPLTAGIKAVCDNVPSLRRYGRFLGD